MVQIPKHWQQQMLVRMWSYKNSHSASEDVKMAQSLWKMVSQHLTRSSSLSLSVLVSQCLSLSLSLSCNTGAWAQGLQLETLQPGLFCKQFFQDRVSRVICPGWLWTVILLISASWVARITGMSHQCLPLKLAQAGLKLVILLPHPLRLIDY
jgi:hypothetical protein